MDKLVSIIMPVYNRQHTIGEAIDSIRKQTYDNWELLVCDDYSTDETKAVVNSYILKDSRIKYIANKGKKGPAAARNMGLREATGEYIAFLDSDDLWLEHHLRNSIKVLNDFSVKVCFSLWIERDISGNEYKLYSGEEGRSTFQSRVKNLEYYQADNVYIFNKDFLSYTVKNFFCIYHINSTVVLKEVVENVGDFDTKLLSSEDTDYLHRVMADYAFAFIYDYHFIYNQGLDNIYWFVNRRKLSVEDILNNEDIVRKLTFCSENKCKMLIKRKKMIKNKVTDLRQCKKVCNNKIADKYFTLAYINRNYNLLKSSYYWIKSLLAFFTLKRLSFIKCIFFKKKYDDMKISIVDLYIT